MGSMMALRAHTQGGPEVLVYESAPRPTPGNGEVLIAVHAAAITFAELTWPETWSSGGVDRTPIIPSHEFSGVATEVGDGVTGLSARNELYGLVPFDRDGAAAEYVSVPATSVATQPSTVSHVVAAAAVLPALTAWEAPFIGAFDWVVAPVLNHYTRIAVEMCAARGILRVVGYEGVPDVDLPQPVTQICEIGALERAA